MDLEDDQVVGTPSAYGDFFMDGLLNDLVSVIETVMC
jgi:hypothetical protein